MSRESVSITLAFGGGIPLLLGVLMMFVTKYYLNNSKKRFRLIELIWGFDNEWHKGKRFDFVMANHVIPSCVFTAWLMNSGVASKELMTRGSFEFPMLHRDSNYEKLLNELRFFVRWELAKATLIFIGFLFGTIVVGMDKNWW